MSVAISSILQSDGTAAEDCATDSEGSKRGAASARHRIAVHDLHATSWRVANLSLSLMTLSASGNDVGRSARGRRKYRAPPRDRLERLRQTEQRPLSKLQHSQDCRYLRRSRFLLRGSERTEGRRGWTQGLRTDEWLRVNAPAGTLAAAIECLNGELDAILASQQMKNGTGARQDTVLRMDAPALAIPAHERRRGGPLQRRAPRRSNQRSIDSSIPVLNKREQTSWSQRGAHYLPVRPALLDGQLGTIRERWYPAFG